MAIKNEADLLLQAIVPRFTPLSVTGLTDDQLTTIANMTALTANNVLTVTEKVTFKTWWDGIVAEYTVLNDQASALGLPTGVRTNYTNSYNALSALVTPWLVNMSIDSVVDGSDFTTDIYDYYEKRQELIAERTNYFAQTAIAGRGVNVCHPRYVVFEEASLPPVAQAGGTVTLDPAIGFYGDGSIKIAATSANAYSYLSSGSNIFNFKITPNKKWIIQARVRCSGVSKVGRLFVRTSSALQYNIAFTTHAVANTWTLVHGIIDLTADNATKALIILNNEGGSGVNMWFDGIMLEEQIGDLTTPSAFHVPPNFQVTYLGDMNATYGAAWGSNIVSQPTDNKLLNELAITNNNLAPALINWSKTTGVTLSTTETLSVDGTSLVFSSSASTKVASIALSALSTNTDYTLSFRVRNTSGSSKTITADLFPDTLPQSQWTILGTDELCTTVWNSASTDMSAPTLRIFAAGSVTGVRIYDVKLEYGAIRTPWSRFKTDLVSKMNKVSPTTYSDFLDQNAITTLGFSQNVNYTSFIDEPISTSVTVDSKGERVLVFITAVHESTRNVTSGTHSMMNLTLVVGGVTIIDNITLMQVPAVAGAYRTILTASKYAYIASPGTGPITYTATIVDDHVVQSGGASRSGNVTLQVMALKR